ncbi:MAG: sigma-70 family RNA polymerase sigma factor [Planctomycetota bacterium]|nr:sigma-70 family RNA polymerase sigma factor [Planctomycetota bacterium]
MIREAKAGSEEAIAGLFLRFDRLIRASVRRVVGRGNEMEDAVQEARMSLAGGLARFDESRPFGPWVQVVARNAAVSYLRRQGTSHRSLEEPGSLPGAGQPGEAGSAVARLDSRDALDRVDAALARLAAKDREILDLRLRRDLPHAEVARLLGISLGSARVRFVRALAALRRGLGESR